MPGTSLTAKADGGHTHNGITFTAWDNANSLPDVGGNYYLNTDVTLSEYAWRPVDGVNICLNGHSITRGSASASGSVIWILDGRTVSLYDCAGNGMITQASGNHGSGVYVRGSFIMYGGMITGIYGERINNGCGVHVDASANFTMKGGAISSNTSENDHGAGVWVESGGTFNMEGGTIENNTTNSDYCYGGGVYNEGTFNISGSAKVTGNTAGAVGNKKVNNVYLPEGKKISIVGALDNSASIGVKMKTAGIFTTGSTEALKASTYKDRFSSDDSTYSVEISGNELSLVAPVAVTSVTLSEESAILTVEDTQMLTATVNPDDADDKKVKWSVDGTNTSAVKLYTNEDCTTEVGTDATDKLTVYAKGISAGSATVTVTSNADSTKKASCAVTVNPITYTVTYKVEGGTWSDGTTTNKTEIVEKGSKPAIVPTGMKAASGYTGGAWDTDPVDATITGAKTFTYTFTAKKAATVTKAPKAKTLTFNGQAQALVDAGTASGGTMQYALGTKDKATGEYAASIPKETKAGTYYVWYKAVGDDSHNDSDPACVTAEIKNQYVVTFKVVNGAWNDGTGADMTVTLTGSKGDTLKLTADQIPEVGNKPYASYKGGSWDVTPSTETAITQDVTYTYTYGQKPENPVTVRDTASVIKGGKTIDLSENVTLNGATGALTYSFFGDSNGCTLNGSVLTSGSRPYTVYVDVKVAEDDTYKASDSKRIKVTVTDKLQQVIEAGDVTATVGDTDKKVTATVTTPEAGGGAISYAVKEGSNDYIDVNATTGALTIKAVPADGKAYVTVTAAETEDYAEASKDVTVTISAAPTPVTPSVDTGFDTVILEVNEEMVIAATVVPADTPVTWTSSEPSVVSVDSTGKLKGLAPGRSTITAAITVDGTRYSDEFTAIVSNEPVPTGVTVTPTSLDLVVGGGRQLGVETIPVGAPVTFTSSNEAVATVDGDGIVTALAPGNAVINATINVDDTVYTGTCAVTVTAESGPSETIVVPEALSDDNLSPEIVERYGSAEQVTLRLEEVMSVTPESRGNARVYDAQVMVITDQGERPATVDDITPEGLEAIFPYPDGTNKDGFIFSGAHMFGETAGGHQAGEIEGLSFRNGDDGLHTVIHGLSPVIITWTRVEPGTVVMVDQHVHVYGWDTIAATADQDGEMRYQCRICGDIQTRVPITAYYIFNKETTEKIRQAKQGQTVKIETARWISFHKMVLEALAERPDVTLEVSFLDEGHKGTRKSFTIPAGTADVTSLVDDKGFAGFIYLTNKFGNTVTTP